MSEMTRVKDILALSKAVYLNDPSGSVFTDSKLLPLFKEAYGYLQTDLQENGLQCSNGVADGIIVKTGKTTLPYLPGDFAWPIDLEERLSGSSDLYQPMVNRRWIPSVLQTDKLIYWDWNGEFINFVGATTDRDIRIKYLKDFPAVVSELSYARGKAEQFLSAKVAALAHIFISQNQTLAQAANDVAEENLEQIINMFAKKQMPVRQKPYIPLR